MPDPAASARLYKTFLFTDIVQSTAVRAACIRRLGDKGNDLFEREITAVHDSLVSGLIERHDGEIVSTSGDSFFAAFSYARDAVECALDIQRAITNAIPVPVADADLPTHIGLRIGLHTGTARQVLRAGQVNYEDHTINVAARIAALAGPQQIFMSKETWDQAGEFGDVQEKAWSGQQLKGVGGEWTIVELGWDARAPRGLDSNAGPRVPVTAVEPAARPPARKKLVWTVTAAAVALVLIAAGWLAWGGARFPGTTPAPRSGNSDVRLRKSVAVLGFKNLTARPDRAWLSTALAEMFSSELAAGGKLRMVAGELVARMRADLELAEADSYSPETLGKIQRHTGADVVLVGSYVAVGAGDGSQIRLDLRLQDVSQGDTVATVTETGGEGDLLALVSRVGHALRTHLGVAALSAEELPTSRVSFPANVAAVKDYTEGLQRLRLYDAAGARELLVKAVQAEPSYPHGHAALAAAWAALGYDANAREEAKKAFDLSAGLPEQERAPIDAQYREVMREWARAAEIHRQTWDQAPDDVDPGLKLVAVLRAAGKPQDALATVRRLRSLPSPVNQDPRIHLAEAGALGDTGDHSGKLEVADRALQDGSARGAKLIVAEAQIMRAGALVQLGRIEDGIKAAETASALFLQSQNRNGAAMAKMLVGTAYYRRNDLDRAEQPYLDALGVFRAIGRKDAIAGTLNNLGNVAQRRSRYADAERFWNEALVAAREAGRSQDAASFLHNLGNYRSGFLGDLTQAEQAYREALEVHRKGGYRRHVAENLLGLAVVAMRRGDLTEAQGLVDEAVELCRALSLPDLTAKCHTQRGHILRLRDEPRKAAEAYQEVARLQAARGAEFEEAALALGLAALDAGNVPEALSYGRQTIETLDKQKRPTQTALRLLASVALERRDLANLDEVLDAARRSPGDWNYTSGATRDTAAAILAARASPQAALAALRSHERTLADKGWVLSAAEAGLAAASLQLRSGSPEAGKAMLARLRETANRRDLALLVRRIDAVAAGSWNPFFW